MSAAPAEQDLKTLLAVVEKFGKSGSSRKSIVDASISDGHGLFFGMTPIVACNRASQLLAQLQNDGLVEKLPNGYWRVVTEEDYREPVEAEALLAETPSIRQTWSTSDGKTFATEEEAQAHLRDHEDEIKLERFFEGNAIGQIQGGACQKMDKGIFGLG